MTLVAAIDCGTNSLRLLIADVDADSGRVDDVDRRTTIVRLGQDVDRTGEFAPAALDRTFAMLDVYAAEVERRGVERLRFVATSAARDVRNRAAFVSGVRVRVGVDPEVISGDEEARLGYVGATRGLIGRPGVVEPVLVVDVGGGSTELVLPVGGGSGLQGVSVDVGSVRLTERHLHGDPPSAGELAAAVADVEAALDGVDVDVAAAGTVVGVAGTITTIAAQALRLPAYDGTAIHYARIPTADVLAAVDELVAMPVEARRALGFMHPGRADVIAGGGLVLAAVLRRVSLPELVVSEHDILDGIAWSLA